MNQPLTVSARLIFGGILICLPAFLTPALRADESKPEKQWATLQGKEGPGKGKHVVLIAGANEYNPETGLPMLGHVLAGKHGFTCTLLFSINKKGEIDTNVDRRLARLSLSDIRSCLIGEYRASRVTSASGSMRLCRQR